MSELASELKSTLSLLPKVAKVVEMFGEKKILTNDNLILFFKQKNL